VKAVTSIKDVMNGSDLDKRVALEERFDQILMRGDWPPELVSTGRDHSYGLTRINEDAFEMFGGYVARQARKTNCAKTCHECFRSLAQGDNEPTLPTQLWIEKRSHGYLLKPSRPLYNLLKALEEKILEVVDQHPIRRDILVGKFLASDDCSGHCSKVLI